MSEKLKRFTPSIFQNAKISLEADFLKGLGFSYLPKEININDYYAVVGSLHYFSGFTCENILNNLINKRKKRHVQNNIKEDYKVTLLEDYEYYRNVLGGKAIFSADSEHTLILSAKVPEVDNIWMGGVSFALGNVDESLYEDKPYYSDLSYYLNQGPIITQIQTVTWNNIKVNSRQAELARFLRGQVHWEFVLIDLICEWAAKNKLTAVYLQSGKCNSWRDDDNLPSSENFLYKRYDETAMNYGFKDEGNGLYSLYLAYN